MNHIQNTICVGSPDSVARAREAVEKNLLICRFCLDKLEFNSAIGPFSCHQEGGQKAQCYICEITEIARFRVSRPQTLKLSGNSLTIPINRETGECEVGEEQQ